MRLIDADALKAEIMRRRKAAKTLTGVDMVMLTDAQPTIEAEPVVRCKDCKHYNTHGCDKGFGWCERNGAGCAKADEWFCEAWEKKGE